MKFLKSINGYQIPFSTSEYEDNSDPLFSDGSGRESLDGQFTGTLIGNFPGLIVTFPAMPNSVQARFKRECKKMPCELEWWDSSKNDYVKSKFYPSPMKSKVMMVKGNMVIMHPFVMQFTTIERE